MIQGSSISTVYSVVALVLSTSLLAFVFYRLHRQRVRTQALKEAFKDFSRRHALLLKKCSLLETHATTYFFSLNDAGLGELMEIRNDLGAALEECEVLVKTDQISEARAVMRFIIKSSKSEVSSTDPLRAKFPLPSRWESHSNELVKNCIIALKENAEESDRIGVDRPGKSRRTNLTIEELVSALEETDDPSHV